MDEPRPQASQATSTQTKSARVLYISVIIVVLVVTLGTGVLVTGKHKQLATNKKMLMEATRRGMPILAAAVEESPGSRKVILPAELRPIQATTVYAKLAGYLHKMLVDKGDRVKKDQVVAVVSSPETDQQVLNIAADLKVKKQIEARYRALIAGGSVSEQELDTARAAREQAQAALDAQLALKSYETIRAPYDGLVTVRYTDGGVLLPAATSSTTAALPLLEIQDTSVIRVIAYVGQAEAPFVRTHDKVHITSRDMPSLNIESEITRLSGALDQHTRTMLIEVDVDNRADVLRPGSYVQLALSVAIPKTLTVPTDAIFFRMGIPHVAVITDGIARYVQVKTGRDDGRHIEILDGVALGQRVGLHIGDAVSDGAKVRVIEPHHAQVPKRE